jgi:sarcosine oxidase
VQGRWDVVVIGAGAMGSAAAWWLARDGRSVLLLDRFPAGHHNGSSHGGSRIFRLAYEEPDYVRMAQAALPLWRELEADAGETLLDITGGVDHGNPASIGRTAAALEACGAPIERMTPAAAEERWPHLRFEGDVLFQPDAGRCRADATVAALHARAAAAGADVRVGQGAAALEDMLVDDRIRVRVNGDAHEAAVAVVATGAWASKVIAGRADLPPMHVTQEQNFHFRPVSAGELSWPSFIHHQMPPRYGLGTPGEGIKVGEHGGGKPCDPDHRDFEVDSAVRARVVEYARRWLPGVDPQPVTETTCLYTTTPTADPVIDRAGPLVIAAGFSGHGFKFTPLFGKLLADLACGREHEYARLRLRRD